MSGVALLLLLLLALQEHNAFEEGLRLHGANWRAVQRMIPTRTLVQIRTHAQKYFLKHGMPPTGGVGGGGMSGAPGASPSSASAEDDGEYASLVDSVSLGPSWLFGVR